MEGPPIAPGIIWTIGPTCKLSDGRQFLPKLAPKEPRPLGRLRGRGLAMQVGLGQQLLKPLSKRASAIVMVGGPVIVLASVALALCRRVSAFEEQMVKGASSPLALATEIFCKLRFALCICRV